MLKSRRNIDSTSSSFHPCKFVFFVCLTTFLTKFLPNINNPVVLKGLCKFQVDMAINAIAFILQQPC